MTMITPAGSDDLAQIQMLLSRCRLPLEGLAEFLSTTVVAREADRVVGCAALEIYGTVGLLRSAAIDPAFRSHGLGQQLVQERLAAARTSGIQAVYLLTETAHDYFPRFGFRPVERSVVSPAIHASVEWTSACPESAQAMVMDMKAS